MRTEVYEVPQGRELVGCNGQVHENLHNTHPANLLNVVLQYFL